MSADRTGIYSYTDFNIINTEEKDKVKFVGSYCTGAANFFIRLVDGTDGCAGFELILRRDQLNELCQLCGKMLVTPTDNE